VKSRSESKRKIATRSFDLCIIGGGATGLGAALDAQLRGLSTCLIEAGDFAGATSSASTKLVHGGVRYLQQAVEKMDIGQFQMVRKALGERIFMLQAAPHLARPLELLVPCFGWIELGYMAIGMKLYELIAGAASLFPSKILGSKTASRLLPTLKKASLRGAVTYADGQFDDARYALALAQSFTDEGGEALNHARVIRLIHDAQGRVASAEVEDQLSGERFLIQARSFLNCTGPFSDHIRQMANPALTPRLRASKGVHILLPLSGIQSETALLIPKTEDGRVIFAIPWFGSLLVGTTEDEVQAGEEVATTAEEVSYLLKYLNRYLDCNFTAKDVLASFAGVRPLVAAAGSVDTKKLVRDHEVEEDLTSGLISILGGKWTTYRAMAEDGINSVQRSLGQQPHAATTRGYVLAGGKDYDANQWQSLMVRYGVSQSTAQRLSQRYGSLASTLLAEAARENDGLNPILPDSAILTGEIRYCLRHEMVATLDDLLNRRLGLYFHSWSQALAAAEPASHLLAEALQWSEQTRQQSLAKYTDKLTRLATKAGIQIH